MPIAQRYLGEEIGRQYVKGTRGGPDAPDDVVVRVRPERWLSADFAKRMGGIKTSALTGSTIIVLTSPQFIF